MRVREYLRLYAQLYGIAEPNPLIDEGLERFRIADLAGAMGTELSSGQRTLIGIVRATLHRPRLLVLDEPTASLDPDVAQRVRGGLLDLCDRDGTALLMTSHDMSDVVEGVRARRVPLARSHRRRRPARNRRVRVRPGRSRGSVPPSRRKARADRRPTERPSMTQPPITQTITPNPMTTRAKSWLRMRAIARRHAYVLVRSPHRLFDVSLWPLVDVLLFGSLAAFVGTSGSTPAAKASGYLLAGIVLWHVIYQSQIAMSTGLLEETWTRNLLNLMVTPLREVEYLGGVALFGMVKLVIGVGVMVIGALAFFSFHTWSLGFGLVPIAVVLLVVGWAISLFVMGLVLRFGTGAEALAWGVMFVLLPLSGVFYPTKALPTLMQPLALALPTTHAFTALRSLVDHRGSDWAQLSIAAVGSLAMLGLAMWFLVAMLRVPQARIHHPLHVTPELAPSRVRIDASERDGARPKRPGTIHIRVTEGAIRRLRELFRSTRACRCTGSS